MFACLNACTLLQIRGLSLAASLWSWLHCHGLRGRALPSSQYSLSPCLRRLRAARSACQPRYSNLIFTFYLVRVPQHTCGRQRVANRNQSSYCVVPEIQLQGQAWPQATSPSETSLWPCRLGGQGMLACHSFPVWKRNCCGNLKKQPERACWQKQQVCVPAIGEMAEGPFG